MSHEWCKRGDWGLRLASTNKLDALHHTPYPNKLPKPLMTSSETF